MDILCMSDPYTWTPVGAKEGGKNSTMPHSSPNRLENSQLHCVAWQFEGLPKTCSLDISFPR